MENIMMGDTIGKMTKKMMDSCDDCNEGALKKSKSTSKCTSMETDYSIKGKTKVKPN
jgi:hypothetical protein